ncbi:Hydroxyethylthiazole kinase family-domain-containing protein [Bisporella sp. PMI_857]|nr:Hydroxyethylthiazole kinase family-domain-containing protein [Bisporella sp. PMI_857]
MGRRAVDYSLYLVTDSTPAILGDRDLIDVVEAALRGGVTLVQYRDKKNSTEHLVATAKRLHTVTQKYKIPLLINDRIDVALAVQCEGVHIGQDDLDLPTARRILGEDAIIGVTVSSIEEAQRACADGADYLGVGTMFSTTTKTDTKGIIGTAGTKNILEAISSTGKDVQTVSIGGINASNVQRVLYQSASVSKTLDGVAIVSAIVAARDPEKASKELLHLIKASPPFSVASKADSQARDPIDVVHSAPAIIQAVGDKSPLSHNMTNLVVQNFAANVALAVGGSPIMANYGEEARDLSKLGGSLVINMGTVTPDGLKNYSQALQAYNLAGGPVVFDPVGGGATTVRRSAIKTLLSSGYFDVIKGNEGEIKAVFGSEVQQKGVDSGPSTLSDGEKATLVRDLSIRERNVVLMTGAKDFVSDGIRTYVISNGHELLGNITGSGCVLGTIISITLAASREDKLAAVVAALLHYEIAAEMAAARENVRGPGTFVPALIDELYNIQRLTTAGDIKWLEKAKVESVHI